MIRIWTPKTIELCQKLTLVTGTVKNSKMASNGSANCDPSEGLPTASGDAKRDRSEQNKGVGGVAKPTASGEGCSPVLVPTESGAAKYDAKRDRSEQNKGVDGVAKPAASGEGGGNPVLVQRNNPVTGKTEWISTPVDYDYKQEIARSSYADMLHDTERNEKYYAAISKSIQQLRDKGQPVHVLDIGTGTGLLSMMAAAEGADTVTACEAFEPMANCAEEVIELNGYSDKISVIHARSTDVFVSKTSTKAQPGLSSAVPVGVWLSSQESGHGNEYDNGDDSDNEKNGNDDPKAIERRANLLVTEVFDTELIGEGAIGTYTHALSNLMQPDCLTVPRAATMFAQPVHSDYIRRWNNLRPLQVAEGKSLRIPAAWDACGGAPSLHDLQLDQLCPSLFSPICGPVKVFRFDFGEVSGLKHNDKSQVSVLSEVDGSVDAVFVWWELEMDPDGEIILSCAPRWAHPKSDQLPWRDHWMQAIFYPSHRLAVKKGENFNLFSFHDEYSLWFETAKEDKVTAPERPICECGLHIAASRPRLGLMNDERRNTVFLNILRKHVTSSTVCAVISSFGLLPLMAAMLGAKKVFVWEESCTRVMKELIQENQLEDRVVVINKNMYDISAEDLQGLKVDLVIGEPYFSSSVLPWDSVRLWYSLKRLDPFLAEGAAVFPTGIEVKAMAMSFKDLWKIRAPVGLCQGFMLNIFDNLIKGAADEVDQTEEPQPLWEYPGKAMSAPKTAFFFGRDIVGTSIELTQYFNCQVDGEVNGVALWCDYIFGEGEDKQIVSTGPVVPPVMGEKVEWDVNSRQAVYLTNTPVNVFLTETLKFTACLQPETAQLKFNWDF